MVGRDTERQGLCYYRRLRVRARAGSEPPPNVLRPSGRVVDLAPLGLCVNEVILVRVLQAKGGTDVPLELLTVLAKVMKEANQFTSACDAQLRRESRGESADAPEVLAEVMRGVISGTPMRDRGLTQ